MVKKFKNIFQINQIYSYVLVPLIALGLNFLVFSLSVGHYIKEGVTFVFINRLSRYLFVLICFSFLAFSILTEFQKGRHIKINSRETSISGKDLLFLLFPLTPVVQYIINNQEILSFGDVLLVLVFFLVFLSIFIFVIPLILGSIGSFRIMMSLGLSFVFIITNMALLSQYFNWFGKGSLKIQLLMFAICFILIWIMTGQRFKQFFYVFIVLSFVVNSGYQLLSQDFTKLQNPSFSSSFQLPENNNDLHLLVEGKVPEKTPNIYLIVFDSYVSNETMMGYGIDNSEQEAFLLDQGFTMYPHTYSIAGHTTRSMSTTFNVSTKTYGHVRIGINGNGIVQNLFKDLGYKNYGLFSSDYPFRGVGSGYDFSIPKLAFSGKHLINGILMGEFRFDIGFDEITNSEFQKTYLSIFNDLPPSPYFIYLHYPDPNHSQNSGVCRSDETELYVKRLEKANSEMKNIVKVINRSDPSSIFIIAGDHGPYLTKNCKCTGDQYDVSDITRLDIQDRFGTFLAVRWPSEDYDRFDDIIVLQDLFPAIFAYIYNDQKILNSRVEPKVIAPDCLSGASVSNGTIIGGTNHGEPLFLDGN